MRKMTGRRVVLGVLALAVMAVAVNTALTQPAARDTTKRPGFNYGGAPPVDAPPVARDDKEKKALAGLKEMTKGKAPARATVQHDHRVTVVDDLGKLPKVEAKLLKVAQDKVGTPTSGNGEPGPLSDREGE